MNEILEKLLDDVTKAMKNVDDMDKRSELISENSKIIEETTGQLAHCIEAIHQFVNNINNISNQTNMLALNASIEAARSGAAGAGFAVVAKSMASLSADTKKAANQILELLNQLDEGIEDMNKAIANAAEEQVEQNESTAQLVEGIKEIEDLTMSLSTNME